MSRKRFQQRGIQELQRGTVNFKMSTSSDCFAAAHACAHSLCKMSTTRQTHKHTHAQTLQNPGNYISSTTDRASSHTALEPSPNAEVQASDFVLNLYYKIGRQHIRQTNLQTQRPTATFCKHRSHSRERPIYWMGRN